MHNANEEEVDKSGWKKWEINRYDQKATHAKFGSIFRDPDTGLWWSRDTAGHGGSAWKVFKETATGLEWFKDADEFGNYIEGKHKGDVGKFIPFKQLKVVDCK